MDNHPLEVKIDSKGARADLAALAKSLEQATAAVGKMQSGFASGMSGVNSSLNASMRSMEKFAQVAGMISKIKLTGDPASHVRQFAQAMNTLARAKAIEPSHIASIKTLSTTLRDLKVPNQAQRLTQFLNAVGAARAPTASTITRINDLLKALSKFQGSAAIRNVRSLQNFFATLASIRVPTAASIARLEKMFQVLQSAKAIPGAQRIAADLDHIAAAAGRAGTAMNAMPARMKGIGPAFAGAGKSADNLHRTLHESDGHAKRATRAYMSIGTGLDGLSSRFRISYQAGTLFSAFFSAFTIGQFLKGIYDANIQILKLQKAMLFTTGSFEGAEKATDQYIAMADNLGLALDKTTEAYSRFTISAKATGIDLKSSNKIFGSVATALQVVGANSNQTELAFYGLTQMMQKGKVVSEEFNRQIGEQIPGNAVIGAQALSKLEGRFVSVAEFFQRMQRGLIISKDFVPAYAEALNTAYSPLIEIAKRRPDVALNRLKNAFQIFAREVGRGGFMAALGTEFDRLHNKIVYTDKDGVEHLTPAAQKLAETLGKNLASMVHVLGKALEFAAQNIDSIISALKALLALKVGATFFDWGQKAVGFAGALIPVKKAAEVAAVGVGGSGLASAAGAAGLGATALPLALRRGGFFRRRPALSLLGSALPLAAAGGFSTFTGTGAITEGGVGSALAGVLARREATRAPLGLNFSGTGAALTSAIPPGSLGGFRGAGALATTANAASAAANIRGMGKLAAEGAAATEKAGVRAASVISKLGGVVGKVLPLLGMGVVGALAAATVALVAFGDRTTTVGGKTVQFNDILAGGFKVATDRIGKWWEATGSKLGLFGFTLGDLGKNAGDFVAHMVAGFITLGQIIGDVVGGIGKTIYDLIVGPFAKLFSVVKKLTSGDFAGAGKEIGDYVLGGGAAGAAVRDIAHAGMNVGRDVAGGAQTKQDVIDAAQAAAGERGASASTDANTQLMNQQAEAALQAADAARQAAQDKGELEALQRRLALGDLGSPKIEDLLTRAQAAWEKTALATDATAQASAATAKNTAGGVTGLGNIPAPPAEIAQAIAGAARSQGVDEALLTKIAFRESSYNPNAKAGSSSAGGLFQITDDTAKQLGVANRFDPIQAATGAARYAKSNAAFLQSHLGREATGGEIYAAHFLGPGGASSLIKAADNSPNANAADLYKDAAKANPWIFYNDPKTKQQPRTVSQVLANLNSTGGAQTGLTGKAIAGATMQDQQTLTTRLDNAMSQYNELVGKTSPADKAAAEYDTFHDKLDKLLQTQETLKQAGLPAIIDPKKIAEADARMKQVMQDAINPFAKQVRLADEANGLTTMRLKGLQDEADFQEKLNQLKEEGYDISKLDTQENRAAVIAAKDRTDALKAQVETIKAVNEAAVQAIARRGSARDIAFSRLVNPKDGESYANAVASMGEGELAGKRQTAAAQVSAQTAEASNNLSGSLLEQATASRLSPSAQALRSDYKQFLEELSGLSDASLSRLEKRADPALATLAKRAAEIKQAMENPPGFQKWADGLEPLKKRLEDIKAGFAEGLSQNITDALYGDKVDWRSFFRDIAKQVTKAQVDSALGGIIGKFTGKGNLTPEQQATIAAADSLTKASEQAAMAQSQAADTSAKALDTSAANLTGAADALKSAAQAIATGGGRGAGGLGGAGGGGLTPSSIAQAASSISGAGGGSGFNGSFVDDGTGGFVGTMPSNVFSGQGLSALPDPLTVAGGDITPASITSNVEGLVTPSALNDAAAGLSSGGGGIGGMMKSLGGGAMSLLGLLGPLIGKKKHKTYPTYGPINGVIGEARPVNVTGTEVAAHSNMVGDLLSTALNMFTGGFGAGGGMSIGKTFANMGSAMSGNVGSIMKGLGGFGSSMGGGLSSILGMLGMFSEGGYSTEPVGSRMMSMAAFHNAPHYAEGTANTAGGMPAILHPNEAVIPLSRGRSIPVDMGNAQMGGHTTVVNSHITVVAPDPNTFRSAKGAMQRQTNRDMKRAAVRNLSPH